MLLSPALIACAEDSPKPFPSETLMHRVYLAHTTLVEAASNIGGDVYLLTIQMKSQRSVNLPITISVSHGSEKFLIPRSLFDSQYGIATTTHLLALDTDHIGFVLTCGDGEHARNCLYRIHLQKRVVCREDWSPFGKIELRGDEVPLERTGNKRSK